MDIKLDEEAVQQAVSAAILQQLGTDGQRTLVTAALTYLTTSKPNSMSGRREESPLQQAFNVAVGQAATKIVHELVAENAEFQKMIKVQVAEAFIKMEATNFSDYLGSALSLALRNDR